MFRLMADKLKKFGRRRLRYVWLTGEMIKRNFLSAMEYRTAFLIQVGGMILNDFGLLLIWVIFFQKFPSINGWHFEDMALVFALATINYGLTLFAFRGLHDIARSVSSGELDHFLSAPVNPLWHVATSRAGISDIGDTLFGVIVYCLFTGEVTLEKTGVFAVVVLVSGVIMFSFMVLMQSLAFYVGRFEDAADQLFFLLIGFALYPQNIFHGALKVVMLTIVPAYFAATLPVELVRSFNWRWLGVLVAFAVFITALALWVFNRGLKRYESGNLINTRM
ncbi:hypothetical protein EPO05_02575 [Patescibacteria group bacterium]|nr:MAG: hypothetical protein EPO05_02575 [Patescibacteria group bacterium]